MTIKEQADAIVEKYRPYADSYRTNETIQHNATQCAIKEVEAVSQVLGSLPYSKEGSDLYEQYQEIHFYLNAKL